MAAPRVSATKHLFCWSFLPGLTVETACSIAYLVRELNAALKEEGPTPVQCK